MSQPGPDLTLVAASAIREAWLWASAHQWEQRARQLEAARPRRGDFTGRATPADLTASYVRLTAAAQACRRRGALTDVALADLDDILDDLTDPHTLDRTIAEEQLRGALERGDRVGIARWGAVVDQLDSAARAPLAQQAAA